AAKDPDVVVRKVEGIGGWLILPLLGLLLSPLIGLYGFWQTLPLFGNLEALNTLQSVFLFIETGVNFLIQIPVPIFLLTLMFAKRARFPRLYQAWLGAALALVLLDLVAGYFAFAEYYSSGVATLFDREPIR